MSSSPTHLVATFTIKPGKLEQFLEGAHQITKTVHEKEPGVLRYFAFQTKSKEGEDQVVFVEKYATGEAHKTHRNEAHFLSFAKQLPGLLVGPFDVKVGSFVAGYENRANL